MLHIAERVLNNLERFQKLFYVFFRKVSMSGLNLLTPRSRRVVTSAREGGENHIHIAENITFKTILSNLNSCK